MKRFWTTISVIGIAGLVAGLYELKYEVRSMAAHADDLRDQIAADEKALEVLDAEWAYLTQPGRLQNLSQRYLQLQPAQSGQFVTIADLPMRPGVKTKVSVPPDLKLPAPRDKPERLFRSASFRRGAESGDMISLLDRGGGRQ